MRNQDGSSPYAGKDMSEPYYHGRPNLCTMGSRKGGEGDGCPEGTRCFEDPRDTCRPWDGDEGCRGVCLVETGRVGEVLTWEEKGLWGEGTVPWDGNGGSG